ncbi:MFS transporter [Haloglycomyces albus]|uniref:MFS transporter n=1 Tax=Haloglycomyces albus TaxID=526067 RepID=UPI00046CD0B4|nr:MFS transporter [Haloglycomyces albus]
MSPKFTQQLHQTFRALSVPEYRIYAAGQVGGTLSFWLQTTTLSWLVLLLSGDSGLALGGTLALQFGPMLLFGLHGGRIADAFDKRRILMFSSMGQATITACLSVIVLSGHAEIWHVYLAVFISGCIATIEGPTRQSFFSELVDRDMLPNAISLGSAIFNLSRICGPSIAGLLIALTSTGTVLSLTAVVFLTPAVANYILTHRTLKNQVVPSRDNAILPALRFVKERRDILAVIVMVAFIGGFAFNFPVTLSMLSKTEFNTDADAFGLLLTSLSVGALVGALVSGRRYGRPTAYTVIWSGLALGVGTTAAGFAPNMLYAAILLVPTGFAMVYFAQAANQRIQMGVGGAMRGRVMSVYMLVFLGSTPICAPIVGVASDIAGGRAGLWLGGGITIATALAGLAAKVIRPRPVEKDEVQKVPASA